MMRVNPECGNWEHFRGEGIVSKQKKITGEQRDIWCKPHRLCQLSEPQPGFGTVWLDK